MPFGSRGRQRHATIGRICIDKPFHTNRVGDRRCDPVERRERCFTNQGTPLVRNRLAELREYPAIDGFRCRHPYHVEDKHIADMRRRIACRKRRNHSNALDRIEPRRRRRKPDREQRRRRARRQNVLRPICRVFAPLKPDRMFHVDAPAP
jgi:hypothetical protein